MKLRRLDTRAPGFDAALTALTQYDAAQDEAVESTVRTVIADVRARGDAALLEYTRRFDGSAASDVAALEVSRAELDAALAGLPAGIAAGLREAAARIRAYHQHQLARSWQFVEADGTVLGQKVTPIERVGVYVPGGKAAYPSSVLMNAIPARVAGVREVVMVSPAPRGERNALVLAAAALAGVDRVFMVGGAQAVAALAYGTASLPRVDKIVGPGNAYVAAAKRHVFGQVGIDMIAGPSEIMVIGDGSAPADWIAMDLFAQAEHDEDAQALLLSPEAAYLDAVEASVERLLPPMARKAVIEASLGARGALVLTRDLEEACAVANRVAPEHLELALAQPERWVERISNAGAIFLGRHSSEAVGDYCAGPNHVLPTAGTARFSSPLGVYDFQKRSSLIALSEQGAERLGGLAALLAEGEGLSAHALSARCRIRLIAVPAAMSRRATPGPAQVIREDVRASSAYHVQDAAGLIKLDAMENPYGLPESLRQEIATVIAGAALNRYPDPSCPALRGQLRATMRVQDSCELLLGNGSDEIIQMIIQAVAKPGARVMAPAPTFVMYKVYAGLCRVDYDAVPLREDFELDRDGFLRAIEQQRPAAIFISYPNNPTGNLFDPGTLEAVIEAAPGLVVIDEAYQPFAETSFLPRIDQHSNLLVLRTVSKLGLAGLRLGYLIGRPEWIAEIDKVRSPYNVGVLTQLVAERILAHPEILDRQAALIRRDREALYAGLARLPGVRPFPSRANFILARVPNAQPVFEALKSRGVLVKSMHGASPLLADCLRFTVGTAEENRILLDSLAKVLG